MEVENILVVDDEEAIREVVSTMLESKGYRCTAVSNGRAAQDQVKRTTPDLVLSDMIMPEMDGIKLLEWLRQYDPEVPVIMVTAIHDISTALEAIRRGAYDYILKPFRLSEITLSVQEALERRRNQLEQTQRMQLLEETVNERTVELRRMLATYLGEYEGFGVAVENRDDLAAVSSTAFTSCRIHRATGRYRFVRPIHETLVDIETMVQPKPPFMAQLTVVHLGYHEDVMAERGKIQRNLRLTRQMFEADPSPKNALEYARSIRGAGGDRRESSRLMAGILATFEEQHIPVENNRGFFTYVLTSLAEDALVLGDPGTALHRARQVVELVPADDLGAKVLAEAALQLGKPQEVLDMQEHRRQATSATPIFRSVTARAALGALEAAALARLGRLDDAFATAIGALTLSPAHFGAWPDMVAAAATLPPEACERVLLALASQDPTGEFFPAVVGKLAPANTARFCLAYCTEGGLHPEAVRVGLVAALLSGLPGVFRDLVAYAGRLDGEILQRIAERARAKEHPELAELLGSPEVPLKAPGQTPEAPLKAPGCNRRASPSTW